MTIHTGVCAHCGKAYVGHGALYCSKACQVDVRKRRVSITCAYCGKVFERPASGSSAQYCSRTCKGAARRKPVPETTCEQCGKPFTGYSRRTRFCSLECAGLARRAQVERTCRHCGKAFVVQAYRLRSPSSTAEYCSLACKGAASQTADLVPAACANCGTDFLQKVLPGYRLRRYCSMKCVREVWRKTSVVRTCQYCGKAFAVKSSQLTFRATAGTFCSKRCHGSYQAHIRQKRVSKAETAFLDALERAGIAIERQYRIGQYVVDACHRLSCTVIEFDGDYWHSLPNAKRRDARRERILRRAGYRVVRVRESTWKAQTDQAIAIVLDAIPLSSQSVVQSELWECD